MQLAPPIIHPARGDLPVLLSVPHSGRDYPDWLVAMARGGKGSLVTLEDPFVDRLIWRAVQRGCGAVIAPAPAGGWGWQPSPAPQKSRAAKHLTRQPAWRTPDGVPDSLRR